MKKERKTTKLEVISENARHNVLFFLVHCVKKIPASQQLKKVCRAA
jgi:hypothetical protein